MNSQFTQRRECRAAAFQYLYAWSVNQPAALGEDLRLFLNISSNRAIIMLLRRSLFTERLSMW